MVYEHFYHKIIQPMTNVNIVDRYNQQIYKGLACSILDFAWNRIKDKPLLMASENFDTDEMVVMVDADYFEYKNKP